MAKLLSELILHGGGFYMTVGHSDILYHKQTHTICKVHSKDHVHGPGRSHLPAWTIEVAERSMLYQA